MSTGQVLGVVGQAAKGARAYEKAEDPIYALENNLPIDFQHYLEHHISQPIMRIFEPMMNNPKDLLSGQPRWRLPITLPLSTWPSQGGWEGYGQPLGKPEAATAVL